MSTDSTTTVRPPTTAPFLLVDPSKVKLSPTVLDRLRRCYNEEISEFKETKRLPAPLFRIVRVEFCKARLLIMRCEVYVNKHEQVVPDNVQVNVIGKILLGHIQRGEL